VACGQASSDSEDDGAGGDGAESGGSSSDGSGTGSRSGGGGAGVGGSGAGGTGAGGSGVGGTGAGDGGAAGSGPGGASNVDNCGSPGACGIYECAPEQLTGNHVATCSEINPSTNPPTSGPHYPVWAKFGVYQEPIPDGFFIHSLEHSAVALLYDCAAAEAAGLDCDELRLELEAFYANWPQDPLCTDVQHRLVVAPNPNLGVPFAAAAWGYYLRGDCFDAERVAKFVTDHYAMNYENICNTGIDPFDPGCPTE